MENFQSIRRNKECQSGKYKVKDEMRLTENNEVIS